MQAYFAMTDGIHNPPTMRAIAKCLLRSSDEEIKEAVELIDREYFRNRDKIDYRRYKRVTRRLRFIYDVCAVISDEEIARCKITGLAKRSIDYHHNQERYERERRLIEEQRNAELFASATALPNVPLPDDPKITFLDTYKSIIHEGADMGHCVAGYASGAVKGRYYIFHIEHEGEHATAQVMTDGRLNQCYGPHNRKNKATTYGEWALRKWGQNIQSTLEVTETFEEWEEQQPVHFFDGDVIPF
jgi:hypothetical protein